MNAIQQISLKLQLGLDPSCNIQSEQLLEKWQVFNARQCQVRAMQRLGSTSLSGTVEGTSRSQKSN